IENVNRETCLGDFRFFTPKAFDNIEDYCKAWSIKDIFPTNQNGVKTDRDPLFKDFEKNTLSERIKVFFSEDGLDSVFRDTYNVYDSSSYSLLARRESTSFNKNNIIPFMYRPFDKRWLYYDPNLTSRPAWKVMQHMIGTKNLSILSSRQVLSEFRHIFVCDTASNINGIDTAGKFGSGPTFPLYLYPTEDSRKQKSLFESPVWQADEANGGRVPNLNPEFVAEMAEKLGLKFETKQPPPGLPQMRQKDVEFEGGAEGIPQNSTHLAFGGTEGGDTFTPEDIFHYIYAIFHSPTYRIRYAEFLKIDFPRVPLTSDVALFRALCKLGKKLVGLHLLEAPEVSQHITRYPVAGDNRVEKGYPKYQEPIEEQAGRVQINKTQYFEGISPEVWEFHVGGYQVLDKWLKDRRGRQLSYDDLTHYQAVVVSLQRTIALTAEIDETIPEWPIC
ncbi:MAG: hypothetical protein KKD28_10975, partial [Chloroflexi bacterium]|nr:hypothetical protein [Chloroflexota bacterium]